MISKKRGRPPSTGYWETREELVASVLEDYQDMYLHGPWSFPQVYHNNGISYAVATAIIEENRIKNRIIKEKGEE